MNRVLVAVVIAAVGLVGFVTGSATASPPTGNALRLMPGAPVVSGTVSYRGWMQLPGMAMLHVELIDASEQGPRAPTLGEDIVWIAGGKTPVSFRIAYDPSRIDPGHVYVVRARITEGERVLFTTTRPHYVLTKGAPATVDLVVAPVRRP